MSNSKRKSLLQLDSFELSFGIFFFTIFIFIVFLICQNSGRKLNHRIDSTFTPDHYRLIIEKEKILLQKSESDFLNEGLHDSIVHNHFQVPKYWKDRDETRMRDDIGIFNFYYDKLDYTDSNYVAISKFYLGVLNLRIDSLLNTQKYWSTIVPLKFSNYYYYSGLLDLKLKDTSNAEKKLQYSIKNKEGLKEQSTIVLLNLYLKKGNYKKINTGYSKKQIQKYLSVDSQMELYRMQHKYFELFRLILIKNFHDLTLLQFLGALLITSVWLFYILKIDFFNSIDIRKATVFFLTGAFAVLIYLYLLYFIQQEEDLFAKFSFMYFFLYAGLAEEFIKVLPIGLFFYFSKGKKDAAELIFYGCFTALGFTLFENFIHFQRNFGEAFFIRLITAVPGHLINTSIICLGFLIYQKGNVKKILMPVIWIALLIFSSFIHGLYDFLATNKYYTLFAILMVFSLNLWMLVLNNSLNSSSKFIYKNFFLEKLRFFLLLYLGLILLLQQITYFFTKIDLFNQDRLLVLLFYAIIIIFLSWRLSNLDMIKNYFHSLWSPNPTRAREGRKTTWLQYLSHLLTGNIIPHPFTFKTFKVKVIDSPDIELEKALLIGNVKKRVLVSTPGINGENNFNNPYWFNVVLTDEANSFRKNLFFYFENGNPGLDETASNLIYLFESNDMDDPDRVLSFQSFNFFGKAVLFNS